MRLSLPLTVALCLQLWLAVTSVGKQQRQQPVPVALIDEEEAAEPSAGELAEIEGNAGGLLESMTTGIGTEERALLAAAQKEVAEQEKEQAAQEKELEQSEAQEEQIEKEEDKPVSGLIALPDFRQLARHHRLRTAPPRTRYDIEAAKEKEERQEEAKYARQFGELMQSEDRQEAAAEEKEQQQSRANRMSFRQLQRPVEGGFLRINSAEKFCLGDDILEAYGRGSASPFIDFDEAEQRCAADDRCSFFTVDRESNRTWICKGDGYLSLEPFPSAVVGVSPKELAVDRYRVVTNMQSICQGANLIEERRSTSRSTIDMEEAAKTCDNLPDCTHFTINFSGSTAMPAPHTLIQHVYFCAGDPIGAPNDSFVTASRRATHYVPGAPGGAPRPLRPRPLPCMGVPLQLRGPVEDSRGVYKAGSIIPPDINVVYRSKEHELQAATEKKGKASSAH
ncbi:unnamed protein product [Vitrella brassicaformis CCMP3155]|uniref:PAN domain-containing protein n=1 Tax=Vitrella brassicaformis (strain CCMP3155) TaxID=1169540 RepID=A0A0G4FET7_VITBC|nr:unnamed protein product [Vitrella brassicaformis CCMP3155]|eukprot:CEM11707.1 unnamed protein product [Vitrella brassicaformis CCMP3155]